MRRSPKRFYCRFSQKRNCVAGYCRSFQSARPMQSERKPGRPSHVGWFQGRQSQETSSPSHVCGREFPHYLDRVLAWRRYVPTPNHALTINCSQMITRLVIGQHKAPTAEERTQMGHGPLRAQMYENDERAGQKGNRIWKGEETYQEREVHLLAHRLHQCSEASRVTRSMVSACRRGLEGQIGR
ncbi:hypothetical protein CPB86DRAFT_2266 [Serendipita vermifera]|nr:hypothetical protein CPB86DRAFT_2266 [Serendipita vermifera]